MVALPGFLVALGALVLVFSGASKLRKPTHHQQSIWNVGWRLRKETVMVLGAGEIAAGGATVTYSGQLTAACLTVVFFSFVVLLLATRRDGSFAQCGCFGEADSGAGSWWHVLCNAAFAGAGVAASVGYGERWVIGSAALGGLTREVALWTALVSLAWGFGAIVTWVPALLPLGRDPVRAVLERRA